MRAPQAMQNAPSAGLANPHRQQTPTQGFYARLPASDPLPRAGAARPCCHAVCHPVRMEHVGRQELEAGLEEIRRSAKGAGTVELIVRRPVEEERELLDEAELDPVEGVVGRPLARGRARQARSAGDADERAGRCRDRPDTRALAPGGRPALRGLRPERGPPAAGHATRDRVRRGRGDRRRPPGCGKFTRRSASTP